MKIIKKDIFYLIVSTKLTAKQLEQKIKELNFKIDSCFAVNEGIRVQGNNYVIELLYNTLKTNPDILN